MRLVCPRCNFDKVLTQKRGVSFINGLAGWSVLGPLGLLSANVGADDLIGLCDCGNSFLAVPEALPLKPLRRSFYEFIIALILFSLFLWVISYAPSFFGSQ